MPSSKQTAPKNSESASKSKIYPRTILVYLFAFFCLHLLALFQLCLFVLPQHSRIQIARSTTRTFLRLLHKILHLTKIAQVEFKSNLLAYLKQLKTQPQALIICANHPSFLDALFLLCLLPNCCCVAKAYLKKVIGLHIIFKANNWPTNENIETLQSHLLEELQQGNPILLFPEGTRTPPKCNLGRLNAGVGVALLAQESGYPILPIRIQISPQRQHKLEAPYYCPKLPMCYTYHMPSNAFPVPKEEHPKITVDRLKSLLSTPQQNPLCSDN